MNGAKGNTVPNNLQSKQIYLKKADLLNLFFTRRKGPYQKIG